MKKCKKLFGKSDFTNHFFIWFGNPKIFSLVCRVLNSIKFEILWFKKNIFRTGRAIMKNSLMMCSSYVILKKRFFQEAGKKAFSIYFKNFEIIVECWKCSLTRLLNSTFAPENFQNITCILFNDAYWSSSLGLHNSNELMKNLVENEKKTLE